MKIGVIIYSTDPEVVFNALRLSIFSLRKGDKVSIFLLAKGVEYESLDSLMGHRQTCSLNQIYYNSLYLTSFNAKF